MVVVVVVVAQTLIDEGQMSTRRIKFRLVESIMFASFDGEWRVQVRSAVLGATLGPRPSARPRCALVEALPWLHLAFVWAWARSEPTMGLLARAPELVVPSDRAQTQWLRRKSARRRRHGPRPAPAPLTCPHVPSRALTCPPASRAPPSLPSQPYSRQRDREEPSRYRYKTKLVYRVDITPKGLVPIPALEWRIREDVPSNLAAVKQA